MQHSTNSIAKRIRDWKLSVFWMVALSAMATLLITVGVLQYRWTKQLSAATEARVASNLRSLMIGWQIDLYGELSSVCVALQVGPDSGAGQDWNNYLRRYMDWSQSPLNGQSVENFNVDSNVVQDIYVWETGNLARPRLLRLNATLAKIEISSVPESVQPLLARLQDRSSSLAVGLRAWELSESPNQNGSSGNGRPSTSDTQPAETTTGWQFDKDVPALVHPIVSTRSSSPRSKAETPNRRSPVNWIVVVLNADYIQRKLLPALTKRYFSGRQGLEYNLALVAKGPMLRLLYSSAAGFPNWKDASFDSRMNVFGPPPESVEGNFWHAITIENGQALNQEEWRSISAPVWFPVIRYASEDVSWTLLLQSRNGSLEAIARNIWHRNLMFSGVVLSLLALSMGLIIIANRRAQRLAKLQLDFVASVSHQLLTPLSAIYCTGQNFRDGIVQTKNDSVEHGSIITTQASRLIDLVREVLLFASTESGTRRYALHPLQVSEILEGVLKSVATLVEGAGFTVEQELEERLPFVMCDRFAVLHCLENLILNAVKYSGRSRWIGISASVHEAANHRKEVRISVRDHGTGISSSDLRHIFEPFYRSATVAEAQIHGTGLGLTVAKRFAEEMGGRLSVASEVNVGSTFTLHLPVPPEIACPNDIDRSSGILLGAQHE